jgi:putative membrane protein
MYCTAAFALLVLCAAGRAEKKPTAKPEDVLNQAAEWNSTGKELSEFAAKNATNAEVRDFARHLADNHTKFDKAFQDAAKQMKVTIATTPNKATRDQVAAIEKLTGKDFDQKFLAFVVENTDRAVKRMEEDAKQAADPAVKTCCEVTTKALRMSLDQARDLQKKLGF